MRSDNVKRKPVLLQQSTPLAGEETQGGSHSEPHHDISIHSSRTGGDPRPRCIRCAQSVFQSTPPAREETRSGCARGPRVGISIHSSRTGGDFLHQRDIIPVRISIHSSRTGGDPPGLTPPPTRRISIHSSRTGGDCVDLLQRVVVRAISIHSSRTGGDATCGCARTSSWLNFNPLLPHGRRLVGGNYDAKGSYFNPLLPHGRRPICSMC